MLHESNGLSYSKIKAVGRRWYYQCERGDEANVWYVNTVPERERNPHYSRRAISDARTYLHHFHHQ